MFFRFNVLPAVCLVVFATAEFLFAGFLNLNDALLFFCVVIPLTGGRMSLKIFELIRLIVINEFSGEW